LHSKAEGLRSQGQERLSGQATQRVVGDHEGTVKNLGGESWGGAGHKRPQNGCTPEQQKENLLPPNPKTKKSITAINQDLPCQTKKRVYANNKNEKKPSKNTSWAQDTL